MNYLEIKSHYRNTQLLEDSLSTLYFDKETILPEKGHELRGEQLAYLAGHHHSLVTDKEFVDSVFSYSDFQSDLEKKQISKIKKSLSRTLAFDKRFVEKETRVVASCHEKWKKARRENDFSIVSNNLKEVLELKKTSVQKLKEAASSKEFFQDMGAYDILFDEYEPGFSSEKVLIILHDLCTKTSAILPELLKKNAPQKAIPLAMPKFEQKKVNKKILTDLGFDFSKGMLSESTHPFCGGSPCDVRLTTRYVENDALNSLFSCIHECGHGIYEQNLPEELTHTPCGRAASLGVHESQSRFYENFIGRSMAFSKYLSKIYTQSPEDIYAQLNSVQMNFIRVDADEVTYNLHIYLRSRIEKELIEGLLSVDDLPERWKVLFMELFGVAPESVSQGCLQDTHWFGGAIGYFPTYSLGNLIAAEIFSDFKTQFPNWENNVEAGDFTFIKEYLSEKVHKHACLYSSPETISKIIGGKEISSDTFFNYINEKYLA